MASNPAKPKLVKTFDSSEKTGLTGPHSPYALPGRMLISYLGGKDGGLPAGLAEFDNDGTFIRKIAFPADAPYGYDVAINPRLNRMVTSSFTPPENYRKPLAKMDLKHFGNKLLVWDFRARQGAGHAQDRPLAARMPLVAARRAPITAIATAPSKIPSGSGRAARETLTPRASCATRASYPPISASRRTGVSCSSAASWATKCSNGT